MGEMTGGLIRMNVHMVVTRDAHMLIVGGISLVFVFAAMAIYMITEKVSDKAGEKRKMKRTAIFAALAVAALITAIVGCNQPRVKEIHACASGPLSLDKVAAMYEIVSVDGSELVLRERG